MYPAIHPYLAKSAFAVNEQYVSPDTELKDGDQLALIPPVSGG
jgi:molybdopterin converting factor small subunit